MHQTILISNMGELTTLRDKVQPLIKCISKYHCHVYGSYVYDVILRTQVTGKITVRDIKISFSYPNDIKLFTAEAWEYKLEKISKSYSTNPKYGDVTLFSLRDSKNRHIIYLSITHGDTISQIVSIDDISYVPFYKGDRNCSTLEMHTNIRPMRDMTEGIVRLNSNVSKALTTSAATVFVLNGHRISLVDLVNDLRELEQSGWRIATYDGKQYTLSAPSSNITLDGSCF